MIENTDVKVSYEAEGKTYVIPFSYESPDDVEVIFTDEAGIDTKLTASAYEVQEGNVVLLEEPQAGTITLIRVQSPTQSLSLTANDRFPASAVEAGMDRTVRSVQQNAEAVARSVKAAPSDTVEDGEITLPKKDQRSDAILGWDENGNMAAVGKASDLAGVYSAKEAAEAARDEAVAAKEAAVAAKVSAESAKNAAVLAMEDAEAAQGAAQAAETGAQDAENNAQGYAEQAQAAKTAAESAQTAAESAKSDAQAANAYASQAAGEALDSQTAAEAAKTAAESARDDAEDAAAEAAQSAAEAALHADEPDNRRKADLSRWPWVGLGDNTAKMITANNTLAALPLTLCLTYDADDWTEIQNDSANGGNVMLLNTYRTNYSNTFYGVAVSYWKVSNALRVNVRIGGNVQVASQFRVPNKNWITDLPTGKHTLCIRIGAHNGDTRPLDGWLDGVALPAPTDTPNFSGAWDEMTSDDISSPDAPIVVGTAYNYASANNSPSPQKIAFSRYGIFSVALPATKADDLASDAPLGYSVEQYDAGEEPPQGLLAEKCHAYYGGQLQGAQWRDVGSARAHAVAEGAVLKADMPALNTDTLTWAGTADAKGFLSATTNTIPANTRVALRLKASAACTVAIGDGAATSPTTYVAAQTLEANKWTDVPAIYTTADGKLTVKPSAAFTGTINAQLTIEPLN